MVFGGALSYSGQRRCIGAHILKLTAGGSKPGNGVQIRSCPFTRRRLSVSGLEVEEEE